MTGRKKCVAFSSENVVSHIRIALHNHVQEVVQMRAFPAVMAVLLLMSPAHANGQTFELHGSAGPTVIDSGYNLAAGLGFSPSSRVTFMLDAERTHLPSRLRTDFPGVTSAFRGGTLTVAAAALRVSLRGRDRVGPYGLAGIAAGVWRSNVTDVFPNPVTTGVRAPFFGGGIQVPLADRLTFFADYRMMLVVGEDADELFAVSPIRAGLAWHF